jgi:hypothetical protein
MEIYLMVAIVYFVLSFIASRLVVRVERWLTPAYLRVAEAKVQPAAAQP